MKWNANKNLGMTLLAVWLIATGLLHFVSLGSASALIGMLLAAIAIVAGVMILLGR